MGNFLSTEDLGEEEQQHGVEKMKQDKKKRRARAKTAKRRAAATANTAGSFAPPVSLTTEGFGVSLDLPKEDAWRTDPEESLEHKEKEKEMESREEEETYTMDYDEPVTKPKRKKRGGTTISRRKRIAWEDEDDEY